MQRNCNEVSVRELKNFMCARFCLAKRPARQLLKMAIVYGECVRKNNSCTLFSCEERSDKKSKNTAEKEGQVICRKSRNVCRR